MSEENPRIESSTKKSGGWLEGRVLGKYKLLEHIGSGAFASIYKAVHLHLPIYYAVKVLHPAFASHEEVIERFFREAQASSQLQHKNVIFIADFAVEEEVGPYIVMEYLEGETLAEKLKREGALTLQEVGEIGYQVCLALDLAHSKGIVHRDLKPDNIFLTPRELGRLQVKILDFGIAHLEQASESITGVRLIGTPIYMAPEQFEGVIRENSLDIYAFGVILFEMLTGKPPYQGKNMHQLGIEHLLQKIPELDEKFPRHLRNLQRELLAKDPADRPQTMNTVRERLIQAIDPEYQWKHWHTGAGGSSQEVPRISLGDPNAQPVGQSKATIQTTAYRPVSPTVPNVSALSYQEGTLQEEKDALQELLPSENPSEERDTTPPEVTEITRIPEPTISTTDTEQGAPRETTDPRTPAASPEFRKAQEQALSLSSIESVPVTEAEAHSSPLDPLHVDEPTLQTLRPSDRKEFEELMELEEVEEEEELEKEAGEQEELVLDESDEELEEEDHSFSEEELQAIQDEAEMLIEEEEDIFANHGDTVVYKLPDSNPAAGGPKQWWSQTYEWLTSPSENFQGLFNQMSPQERRFLFFVWVAVAFSVLFSLFWILLELLTSGA